VRGDEIEHFRAELPATRIFAISSGDLTVTVMAGGERYTGLAVQKVKRMRILCQFSAIPNDDAAAAIARGAGSGPVKPDRLSENH